MANGYISDAFADLIVKAILTRNVSILPTSYFFGLTLEVPTDQNGTGLVSPDALEYNLIEVVAEDASWISSGVGSRMMVTNIDVVYNQAVTDWGEIKGYTIYDSAEALTLLGFGFTVPYTITAGMIARLPAGLIEVSLLT